MDKTGILSDEDIDVTDPVDPTTPDPENPDVPIEPPVIDPDNPDEPIEPPIDEEPKEYYMTIPDFYDRVRVALNVQSTTISDDVIDYPENAPIAEMKIKSRIPNWEELEGIKETLFQTCIVYMTCYQLCPIVSARNITEQTTPSLTLKFSTNTNGKPCERFLALIDDLIAQIMDEELQWSFGFEVTKPSSCCCKKVVWDAWNKDNKNAFNPLGSE